jgi:hypothetical protein
VEAKQIVFSLCFYTDIFVVVFKNILLWKSPAFHMLGAGMVLQEQIVAQQVKQFLAFYVI